METKITPWPVYVDHVVKKTGTRTRNNVEIDTETYLVYIKKSMFQQEQPLSLPLYKGTHDALISMFEGATWEKSGDDDVLTPASLKELAKTRLEKWDSLSDDEKLNEVMSMDITIPRGIMADDAKKKAFCAQFKLSYANMPLRLRTEYAQNEPQEGDLGVIFGNLPIDGEAGTTLYYVLNKDEILTKQNGTKVTQTHDRVCAMVKFVQEEWIPVGDASSLEEALRLRVIDDISRGRFKKVESLAETLERLKSTISADEGEPEGEQGGEQSGAQ